MELLDVLSAWYVSSEEEAVVDEYEDEDDEDGCG